MMVSIKDSLFKEYDLRGVVGDELTGNVPINLVQVMDLMFSLKALLKQQLGMITGYQVNI